MFHFTQAENLKNIMLNGLLPRSVMDKYGVNYLYNDENRYDNCKNAICTSIGFPNYKMFYSLRMQNPDVKWVVIALNPRILCDMPCAYCTTNASDNSISGTSLESRMTNDAFLKLFEEQPYPRTRSNMKLPSCYPTNPQAEVLVFSKIPTSYFYGVVFNDENCRKNNHNLLRMFNIKAYMNTDSPVDFFSCRKDYSFWR